MVRPRWSLTFLPTGLLVIVTGPAKALDLDGGVSVGAIVAGPSPHLAVTPHAAVSWRTDSGVLFSVRDLCSVLPATNRLGTGVHNQVSAAIGYAWESGHFGLGPALSIYSMPACGEMLCGRVVGIAAGGHVQANLYFAGPLGVSVSVNLGWVGGRSLVLPGGIAGTFVAGPVLRWSST